MKTREQDIHLLSLSYIELASLWLLLTDWKGPQSTKNQKWFLFILQLWFLFYLFPNILV